ncbi:MAG: SPFH domain-containing protein [Proteobacteria bacterium]|nr:SPFH domain-containing protein [Pseudomonadota bacterium]
MADKGNSKSWKTIRKLGIAVAIASALMYVLIHCFSWIESTERGVLVKNGEVQYGILQPGLVIHAPFITDVYTIPVAPQLLTFFFSERENGLITKDMQTVGGQVQISWKYQESQIIDIVKRYKHNTVETEIQYATIASFKEFAGDYTIDELLNNKEKVGQEVIEIVKKKISKYPVEILQMTIVNWDLSDSYKRYLQENNIKYP